MKRRILAIIMGLCVTMSLVGCGNGEISNDKITIKQYKGLEITETVLKVTDEDVEMSIESTLQTLSTRTDITDRPAQEGDTVVIDYEGKIDGVAFDGGTATEQTVEIGAGMFIPGFEDGIIGHNTGESFDVSVTFPEDYQATELAGKAAVFSMTLHSIQEVYVPELTEELLPQLSETAKTIKEYKAEVRKQLEESNQASADSANEQAIWEKLLENCVVQKYPEGEVEQFVANVETQFSEYAAQNNTTAAELFKMYYGVTPEDYVKNSVKMEYAIELIAEKEKITLSVEEYDEGLEEYAMSNGFEDTKAAEEAMGRETMELVLLQPKVAKFLLDNCKKVQATE